MNKRAYIKPTKPSLKVGMIVVAAMICFAIFFLILLITEGDNFIGIIFICFWILVMIVIGSLLLNNYRNYDKNPSLSSAEEVIFPNSISSTNSEYPFYEKLQKLEELKKQNLISEMEYNTKRSEILSHKW
jgi:hypothetical protein